MMDCYKLREDGPRAWAHANGYELALPFTNRQASQFMFADGEDAEVLDEKAHLDKIPGERLGSLIGGSADDAAGAISAGEADDILDAVLFAEREREQDERVPVIRAIMERSDELATEDAQLQEHEQVGPSDLVTTG